MTRSPSADCIREPDFKSEPKDLVELDRLGRRLQWTTIAWNCLEVLVTIGLGLAAGSLALIAFGLDSLVEVFASLVIIWNMRPDAHCDLARRDRRAVRRVGLAFFVLSAYLMIAGVRQLVVHQQPTSSPAGIAYLLTAAGVMFGLAHWKRKVGKDLNSGPFLAEASMTFLDGCLAVSILTALAANLVLGWWWADAGAALLIGAIAALEGRHHWLAEDG